MQKYSFYFTPKRYRMSIFCEYYHTITVMHFELLSSLRVALKSVSRSWITGQPYPQVLDTNSCRILLEQTESICIVQLTYTSLRVALKKRIEKLDYRSALPTSSRYKFLQNFTQTDGKHLYCTINVHVTSGSSEKAYREVTLLADTFFLHFVTKNTRIDESNTKILQNNSGLF